GRCDVETCGTGMRCDRGVCECAASCAGKTCGDDNGCGGTCHDCPGEGICDIDTATCCTPDCSGKSCGDADGCGGRRDVEACGCTAGDTQACFPGPRGAEGVGACQLGTQTCVSVDEFSSWGDCVGAVLPTADRPGDGVDSDCGGTDDADDPSTACIPNEYGEG